MTDAITDVLAVDVGGTKVEVCACRTDGSALLVERVATAGLRRGGLDFADDVLRLVRANMAPDTERVAVSWNGALDSGTVVFSSLLGGAVDYPLAAAYARRLGVPVLADDDLHAMSVAEWRHGAGARHGSIAVLNLGTGIGVGYCDPAALRGRHSAGHLGGHPVYLPELGRAVPLDDVVSGRGIRELYRHLGGGDRDARDVLSRPADPAAWRAVEIFTRELAGVLALVSRAYHPEAIVLNGSVGRAVAPDPLDRAVKLYRGLVPAHFWARWIGPSELPHAACQGAALRFASRDGLGDGSDHG